MTEPSSRDLEQISAYLDGQLSGVDVARLESRIKADPELRSVYDGLRQTRSLLRQLPARRAPRNFKLTPQMVGIKATRPRSFSFFRLASVLAMLLLFLGYAVNLSASNVGMGAATMYAPVAATQESLPFDTYAAPAADEATATEAMAEPTAEISPKMMPLNPTQTVEVTPGANLALTPSPEAVTMAEPTATVEETMRIQANSAAGSMPQANQDSTQTMPYLPEPPMLPIHPLWLFGLLGLAAVSGASAFIVDKRASRAKPTTKEIVLIIFALVVAVLLAAGIYFMSSPR